MASPTVSRRFPTTSAWDSCTARRDVIGEVTTPTLVTDAEKESIAQGKQLHDALTSPKEFVFFEDAEGAAGPARAWAKPCSTSACTTGSTKWSRQSGLIRRP